MNNGINKQQNNIRYLRYRYVFRTLYTNEKIYRSILILFGVIVYIIGILPDTPEVLVILPIIWLIMSECLKKRLNEIHLKAVEFHEYCDREMFGFSFLIKLLDNNNSLYQEATNITNNKKDKVKFEEMCEKEHQISIKNWYSNFQGVPQEIAIIMAQDENINWEYNQRKAYRVMLNILFIFLFFGSTIVLYLFTKEFYSIIFAVPIVIDCFNLILDNNASIKRCEFIREKIGTIYNELKTKGKNYDLTMVNVESNCIQLKIYENRKESISVPDIVYKLLKSKLQKQSDDYIKSIKQDIKNYLKR